MAAASAWRQHLWHGWQRGVARRNQRNSESMVHGINGGNGAENNVSNNGAGIRMKAS